MQEMLEVRRLRPLGCAGQAAACMGAWGRCCRLGLRRLVLAQRPQALRLLPWGPRAAKHCNLPSSSCPCRPSAAARVASAPTTAAAVTWRCTATPCSRRWPARALTPRPPLTTCTPWPRWAAGRAALGGSSASPCTNWPALQDCRPALGPHCMLQGGKAHITAHCHPTPAGHRLAHHSWPRLRMVFPRGGQRPGAPAGHAPRPLGHHNQGAPRQGHAQAAGGPGKGDWQGRQGAAPVCSAAGCWAAWQAVGGVAGGWAARHHAQQCGRRLRKQGRCPSATSLCRTRPRPLIPHVAADLQGREDHAAERHGSEEGWQGEEGGTSMDA